MATIDWELTEFVFNIAGSSKIPRWFGLIPYEIYAVPGMLVSILIAIHYEDSTPLQIHIFPHLLTFSLIQLYKHWVSRKRPGCYQDPGLNIFVRDSLTTCAIAGRNSFPSGHAGISAALATALILYIYSPISIVEDPIQRAGFSILAALVSVLVMIHRVSYGYHFVSDVVVGALIGVACAAFSYHFVGKDESRYEMSETLYYNMVPFLGVLSALGILLFFVKDLRHNVGEIIH